jgi:methylmalonyl-CoA/ethylmalonyl-CoA epimerase
MGSSFCETSRPVESSLKLRGIHPDFMAKVRKKPANNLAVEKATTKFQVGLVVKDAKKVARTFEELFGIGPFIEEIYTGISATLRGRPIDFKVLALTANFGPIELEVCQPLEGHSVHQDFLEKRGEGVNHIGFYMKDYKKQIQKWKKRGIDILQFSLSPPPYPVDSGYAYMDTERLIGTLLEIADRPAPALA